MPERIQLSRTKGWRMPPNTVKVDRATRWGNPFNATQTHICFSWQGLPAPLIRLHEPPNLGRCLDLYSAWLLGLLVYDPHLLAPLTGKNLACWCAPEALCHADILLRLANPDLELVAKVRALQSGSSS